MTNYIEDRRQKTEDREGKILICNLSSVICHLSSAFWFLKASIPQSFSHNLIIVRKFGDPAHSGGDRAILVLGKLDCLLYRFVGQPFSAKTIVDMNFPIGPGRIRIPLTIGGYLQQCQFFPFFFQNFNNIHR